MILRNVFRTFAEANDNSCKSRENLVKRFATNRLMSLDESLGELLWKFSEVHYVRVNIGVNSEKLYLPISINLFREINW